MKKKWILMLGGCASCVGCITFIVALIGALIVLVVVANFAMMAEMGQKVSKKDAIGTYIGDITEEGKHYHDVLVLKPDGTFDQTYTPPQGRIRKAHGTWKLSYGGWMDGTDITLENFVDWDPSEFLKLDVMENTTYIYHLNGEMVIGMAGVDPDEWGTGYIKQKVTGNR